MAAAPSSSGAELPPPARFDRAKAEEIVPLVGREKTIGRLYNERGEPVGELIYSSKSGPGTGGPGLRGDWKLSEALTEHAEGHAAATMRLRRIRDATLYLNKHPCRKPAGCHNNIEKALPRGWRLTVWVCNADGSALRRRYVGTGEAVEE